MTFRIEDCDSSCACRDCSQNCVSCRDWEQIMVSGCPVKECAEFTECDSYSEK